MYPLQTATLQFYSGYSEGQLEACLSTLALLVERMPLAKEQAVREKYSNSKLMGVANARSFARQYNQATGNEAQPQQFLINKHYPRHT